MGVLDFYPALMLAAVILLPLHPASQNDFSSTLQAKWFRM
jgi:hypothetical protein